MTNEISKLDEYTARLVEITKEVKHELPRMGIRSGWISIADGLKNIPTGTQSQDWQRGMDLARLDERNDQNNEMEKNRFMLIVIACIFGFLLFTYIIVKNVA